MGSLGAPYIGDGHVDPHADQVSNLAEIILCGDYAVVDRELTALLSGAARDKLDDGDVLVLYGQRRADALKLEVHLILELLGSLGRHVVRMRVHLGRECVLDCGERVIVIYLGKEGDIVLVAAAEKIRGLLLVVPVKHEKLELILDAVSPQPVILVPVRRPLALAAVEDVALLRAQVKLSVKKRDDVSVALEPARGVGVVDAEAEAQAAVVKKRKHVRGSLPEPFHVAPEEYHP